MVHILFSKYVLYFLFGLFALIAGLAVYLMWFQPPFHFPKPTGEYAVGTTTYHWIDSARREQNSDDPSHPNRELMVQIYYPSLGTLAEKPSVPYAPLHIMYFLRKRPMLKQLIASISRPIFSYAIPEAMLANNEQQYPVIIYSHGSGGIRNLNTAHFEALASQGYIVVAISHTYYSCLVQFPNGRQINVHAFEHRQEKALSYGDKMMEVWITDVQFVLDKLEQLSNDHASPFYHRLDIKHIGMFGHSFGGGAALQACRRDPRIHAAVAMEPALWGFDATKPFYKPCMFMLGDISVKDFQRPWSAEERKKYDITSDAEETTFKSLLLSPQTFEKLAQSHGRDAYIVTLKGAGHLAFCDITLLKHTIPFSRLLRNIGTGPLNGFRATEIVSDYLVNFFDKYLKGESSDLLDGSDNKYEEVD